MDNFARVLSLAPTQEWTPDKQLRLEALRTLQRANKVLLFLPHCTSMELLDFQPGKLYQIQVFDNIDIVHAKNDVELVSFSAHVMLERFTYVGVGDELAFVQPMNISSILSAADQWLALGKLPVAEVNGEVGFSDGEDESTDTLRSASFYFSTKSTTVTPHLERADALSKLTEMADVVRAQEIEDLHEKSYSR